MEHGDDGDADVHLGAAEADFDASILGEAFFSDVKMAENFDAGGNNRGLKALELGRDGDFLQDAVNAVADAEFVFEGLEVNVGRAEFDGVGQDLVHKFDDGGVFGGIVEVAVVFAGFIDDLEGSVFFQGADGVRADAEMFFHLALDGFAGGEDGLDFEAGEGLEGVEALGGEEAAGGDFDGAVGAAEGEEFLLEQDAGGEKGEEFAVRLDVIERGVGDGVFLGEPAEDVVLGLRGRWRPWADWPRQGRRVG